MTCRTNARILPESNSVKCAYYFDCGRMAFSPKAPWERLTVRENMRLTGGQNDMEPTSSKLAGKIGLLAPFLTGTAIKHLTGKTDVQILFPAPSGKPTPLGLKIAAYGFLWLSSLYPTPYDLGL